MNEECSWCVALGHNWNTFQVGEECPLCGEKKPVFEVVPKKSEDAK